MRLEVSEQALASQDLEHQRCLTRIFYRCADGVHRLYLFGDVESSAWFIGLSHSDRELARLLIGASSWSASGRVARATCGTELERLLGLAHTPLMILVENSRSDGALIDAAVLAYADASQLVLWRLTAVPPVWQFAHGGGDTITVELQRFVTEAKQQQRAHRIVVVHDSDATESGAAATLTTTVAKLTKACRTHEVSFVLLKKREVENYLPDELFDAWLAVDRRRVDSAASVDAVKRLAPEQRDYIDLEGDPRLDAEAPLGSLFAGVDTQDRRALRKKNFKKVHVGEDDRVSIVLELPIQVRQGRVTAEHLDQRDPDGELRALVKLIFEEL